MPKKPNRIERVEAGHLIRLRVFDGTTRRDRIIKICSGGHEGVDFCARPPCHPIDSEFVAPFLGKERGHSAQISGSRATQVQDYEASLVDILHDGDPYDPSLIDSYERPAA